MLTVPAPAGMGPGAQKMAAVAFLMATWWMTEAIPIPATSLMPIALFPILGIMHTKAAAAPYASHLIFLGVIITVALLYAVVIPLFGVEVGVIPDWAMIAK